MFRFRSSLRQYEDKPKPSPLPPLYDKNKKYKPGDVVTCHFPRDNLYRCHFANPRSAPTSVFLRASHDLFANEISQPSSSYGVSTVCKLHLMHTYAVIAVAVRGRGGEVAAVLAVVANLVAAMSMANAGVRNCRDENEKFVREELLGGQVRSLFREGAKPARLRS